MHCCSRRIERCGVSTSVPLEGLDLVALVRLNLSTSSTTEYVIGELPVNSLIVGGTVDVTLILPVEEPVLTG